MYYIGYYTLPHDIRISSPAANLKIESIARAAEEAGETIDILSTCVVASKKGIIKKKSLNLSEHIKCIQFGFVSSDNKLIRSFMHYLMNIKLFLYILFVVKREDTVIVYHALERSKTIILAQKMIRFKLILEVEELYADVTELSEKLKLVETEIIELADEYIFSTEFLNKKVNRENKPYAVINGTYINVPDYGCHFNDEKIHVVYAGTLKHDKGAFELIEAAKNLNSKYHIHILGYGRDDEIDLIKNKIHNVKHSTECTISYDGYKQGEDFTRFIQCCQIGLCTQDPTEKYNDTSFPSKILTYFANGLHVVSIRIPAVAMSEVGKFITFYDVQSSENIAKAIMKVQLLSESYGRETISILYNAFVLDMKRLLNK